MTHTLERSDDLAERLDGHREEFVEELVSISEAEGTFMQEGYSE